MTTVKKQVGPALSEKPEEIGFRPKYSQNYISIPAVLFCALCLKFTSFKRFHSVSLFWIKQDPPVVILPLAGLFGQKHFQPAFWVSVPDSSAVEIGNSDRNTKTGQMCFEHLSGVEQKQSDYVVPFFFCFRKVKVTNFFTFG